MYCPESWRPTLVSVKTPPTTVCFHGSGARSLDQVMTGGGEPKGKGRWKLRSKTLSYLTYNQYRHLTAGLTLHGDCVPLHCCDFCGAHWSHRCPKLPLDNDFNFGLCHPLSVRSQADINSRVFWTHCRPLRKQILCFYFAIVNVTINISKTSAQLCISPLWCWHHLPPWYPAAGWSPGVSRSVWDGACLGHGTPPTRSHLSWLSGPPKVSAVL